MYGHIFLIFFNTLPHISLMHIYNMCKTQIYHTTIFSYCCILLRQCVEISVYISLQSAILFGIVSFHCKYFLRYAISLMCQIQASFLGSRQRIKKHKMSNRSRQCKTNAEDILRQRISFFSYNRLIIFDDNKQRMTVFFYTQLCFSSAKE